MLGAKRVLIITYYWPPGGGAGVQRWLKFVKYLPKHGWTPVVYTPENGEMPVMDESLLSDVPPETIILKTRIWEPYSIYKKFIGAGKHEKINTGFLSEKGRPGFAERFSVWIRGNFFIPDARCFWIKPSVKFLSEWLGSNPVDAIVSTGPPHSMHLIAMPLAKKFNIPWIADFRDPWTNIDYYNDLMLTKSADAKHHKLEKEVITSATRVITVSKSWAQDFEKDHHRKVDVITNGYDEDDNSKDVPQPEKFILSHVGTLVRSRNHDALWSAVVSAIKESPQLGSDLLIKLIGKVDVSVRNSIKKFALEKSVEYIEYLPHESVTKEQQSAALLLLILNNTPNVKGIIPGKMFEYLSAHRPILCIGSLNGDSADIIRETESGKTFDFYDSDGIKDFILESYELFNSGNLRKSGKNITQYNRKELTGKFAALLESVVKSNK